jgi:hypothetical protein
VRRQQKSLRHATPPQPCHVDAFALAIIAAHGEPAYAGLPGNNYDASVAAKEAKGVAAAMEELWKIAPRAGSYVSESDFLRQLAGGLLGNNYSRLAAVKKIRPGRIVFRTPWSWQ